MILMLVADRHQPLLITLLMVVALAALGFNRLFRAIEVNLNAERVQTDEFWIGLICLVLAIAVVI